MLLIAPSQPGAGLARAARSTQADPVHRREREFDRGLARLDKTRPVLVLTGDEVRALRRLVTIALVTSTVRGLRSEIPVDQRNGLEHHSVVNLDSIATVPHELPIRPVGALREEQERDLTRAFHEAFDLEG